MSIVSEIERIKLNIANAYTACEGKGATMPSILNSANLADCIASITGEIPDIPVDTNYVTYGLVAHFSGEDDYVDGAWVDRVNGYKFTPSTSAAPVYDATNKLYQATSFGGMQADFKTTANATFSIEVVVRDVKNVVRNSTQYGAILGTNLKNSTFTNGPAVFKRANGQCVVALLNGATMDDAAIEGTDLVDGALDTLTLVPSVGYFRNGVKFADASSTVTESNLGLFAHYEQVSSTSNNYKTKGKIHAVRYYNRLLTAEEIAQNHAEDVRIYGK